MTPAAPRPTPGPSASRRLAGGFSCRRAASIVLLLLCATPCLAWGTKGHAWITANAIVLLPEGPMKALLSAREGAVVVACMTPDFQWKDGSIGKLEAPDHYLDLEVLSEHPTAADIPRTRLEAARLYTDKGLRYSNGGFLPWRVEETYLALVNAIKTDRENVPFWAGILAHYVGDATMPLHTTIHFDGRVDGRIDGVPELKGIHADYEIAYLEDHGFEFRRSSLALAHPVRDVPDVFSATTEQILHSFSHVDGIYRVARAHQGDGKYEAWDRELGQMTRQQLADAATLLGSLWQTAWEAGGDG